MPRFMLKVTTVQEFWMEVDGQDENEVHRMFWGKTLRPTVTHSGEAINTVNELKELI